MNLYREYAADECGEDGYPLVWHQTLKHEVRETAGHRCVRCGHPYTKGDGEWSACDELCTHGRIFGDDGDSRHSQTGGYDARWRILTVHHLDGNKSNCRWWNLVSLCQRCHLRVQRVVVMERVWPWEHSEWFRPYVAGYYAHVYLGEIITREQAVERMDDLLILERIA